MTEVKQYKNSAQKTKECISQLLGDRLNKLGSISADDAWQICRSSFPYGTVILHFKAIMTAKMNNDEADYLGPGKWFIYRQKKQDEQKR